MGGEAGDRSDREPAAKFSASGTRVRTPAEMVLGRCLMVANLSPIGDLQSQASQAANNPLRYTVRTIGSQPQSNPN